ncbi:transcriptional regulator, LacI family [Arthrobacter sp. ov407]|uniref:LacI family DNA-binding transcriptional regulator n=1 Tax=Arthrobacter sp. ov407 TaxID=1761748 RepID=UPI00087E21CB|nr:LacI family DNA-binding transcriptional regulator [Arthrobacter sp. ov407]SDL19068.1 transcriptional regulator, LacI family [Arthrobacter sp. ov407]
MTERVPRRPTIKSVAQAAGVSTATVSYVLSGRNGNAGGPGVSAATALRVQEAARALGYRPNQAARAIRTGKTDLMMLSLTMISDPWSLDVSRAVGSAAAAKGITPMILADTDWRVALRRQNADVTFIDAADREGDAELLALAAQRQRLVVFSETLEPVGFDVVRSLAGDSCQQAVDHLCAKHSRVAALTSSEHSPTTRSIRFDAYTAGLERAGLPFRADYVATYRKDSLSAVEAATALLLNPERPTAIYATTDYAAIGAIHAAQRLQLRVPEDVEVVGIGNTTEGENMTPSLTTVGPLGFFDGLAAFLVTRAASPAAPATVLEFPWQLIVRQSA